MAKNRLFAADKEATNTLSHDFDALRDRSVREVAGRLIRPCGRETDAMQLVTRKILSGQETRPNS